MYGTNDNYHPENSHVLPSLIRRIILAKKNNDPSVVIWGTGTPRREFMHVDDLADACYFLLHNYNEAGHAIVSIHEPASDPIHKATIIPRGRALGMVMRLPERDNYSYHRDKMHANLSV
ncbi:MAG: hypothetical protein RLZZ379_338, partial [Pseudomonadota bacterium]